MKGGDFERVISKKLSVWLTGKEKPYQFWRMPASGGLATISEENKKLSGDIRALTRQAEFFTDIFNIECKNGYPRASFWQVFKEIKNLELKSFWEQCCLDAMKAGKWPMLIYRKKGQKIILGISTSINTILEDKIPEIRLLSTITVKFDPSLPQVIFYDFENFFDIIKPEIVKELQ